MKTNFTQRKFYIVYFILVVAIFFSRKSFAQCGSSGGNGAITSTNSIVIDGNMSDWTTYVNDPDNNTWDGTPDRDSATITDPGRDMLRYIMTQGSAGLYMYFSRAASNNNTLDFLIYLDINNNAKMDKNEPVVDISWNGANRKGAVSIYNYNPANAAGDSISHNGTTDGYTLPGTLGNTPRTTIGNNGYGSVDGQSLEVLVPWSYITQTNASGTVINSLVYSM
ncbi:MAG: hypothetical protein ACM3H8_04125, partial [Sphingobacteriales bacterium]